MPSFPGGFSSPNQFSNVGQRQAAALKLGTEFTTKPLNWGVGGNPIVTPSGGTVGGVSRDAALNRVLNPRGAAAETETVIKGGKLTDASEEFANPYAAPPDMGQPTPPPLTEAAPPSGPASDPSTWANPFPNRSQSSPPPSPRVAASSPVAAPSSSPDPLVIAGIALALYIVFG